MDVNAPSGGTEHPRQSHRYKLIAKTFAKRIPWLRAKLEPGRYNLVARTTDAAGNRSKRKRVKFRIDRRKNEEGPAQGRALTPNS